MKRTILALLTLAPCAVFAQDPAQPAPASPAPAAVEAANSNPTPSSEYSRGSLLDGYESLSTFLGEIDAFLASQGTPTEATAGEPLSLTAETCVQMALTQNAKAFVAQDDVDAAKARIGQARSAMLPQLSGSMGFAHTELNIRTGSSALGSMGGSSLGGGFGGGFGGGLGGGFIGGGQQGQGIIGSGVLLRGAIFLVARSVITNRLTDKAMEVPDVIREDKVSLDQVLYAGGQIKAAMKAAKFLAESQEWQKEVTLAELEFEAKKAYYDAATSEALVRVAEASVRTFERNRSDAQQMFDVGMTSSFEVLRAETEMGSRKATLVEANNVKRLAQANLRRIIAVPQNTPVALATKLDWQPATPNLDELVKYANEHRPEILALKKGIEAAKQDIARVRGQFKPQVGANIQWKNTDNGGSSAPDGWTFNVGIQQDFYKGGKRKYDVAEAKARLSSIEHQLEDVEQLIELDVTQALIQIKDSMAKISSENGTRKLAEEGLRLAELRFQEGVGTQGDTLDAELALTNAETALVQAMRDFAIANASLERAIGKSWSKADPEGAPVTGHTQNGEPAK
ncbi:MAG: TolC family protein [Candidatus Hydrogenedentes bacterium]|nr:TolC family protein [Candidatus Hydrogenedentota bacterium]